MTRNIPPIHPGETLKEEFLDPLGITAYRLAKMAHMPQDRVSSIVHGRRGTAADPALQYERFFGVESPKKR